MQKLNEIESNCGIFRSRYSLFIVPKYFDTCWNTLENHGDSTTTEAMVPIRLGNCRTARWMGLSWTPTYMEQAAKRGSLNIIETLPNQGFPSKSVNTKSIQINVGLQFILPHLYLVSKPHSRKKNSRLTKNVSITQKIFISVAVWKHCNRNLGGVKQPFWVVGVSRGMTWYW